MSVFTLVAQASGGAARTVGPMLSGALYYRVGPPVPFLVGAAAAFGAMLLATGLRPSPGGISAPASPDVAPPPPP